MLIDENGINLIFFGIAVHCRSIVIWYWESYPTWSAEYFNTTVYKIYERLTRVGGWVVQASGNTASSAEL